MRPKKEEEVLWHSAVMMDTVRAENKNHSQRWGGEAVYQVDVEESYYGRVCGFFSFGKYFVFVFVQGHRLTLRERAELEKRPRWKIPMCYFWTGDKIQLRIGFRPGRDDHLSSEKYWFDQRRKKDRSKWSSSSSCSSRNFAQSSSSSSTSSRFGAKNGSSSSSSSSRNFEESCSSSSTSSTLRGKNPSSSSSGSRFRGNDGSRSSSSSSSAANFRKSSGVEDMEIPTDSEDSGHESEEKQFEFVRKETPGGEKEVSLRLNRFLLTSLVGLE